MKNCRLSVKRLKKDGHETEGVAVQLAGGRRTDAMCQTIRLPGGQTAIVCGARQRKRACSSCGRSVSDYKLCDFLVDPSGDTCSRVLCVQCAIHREPDLDYCPRHGETLAAEAAAGQQQFGTPVPQHSESMGIGGNPPK